MEKFHGADSIYKRTAERIAEDRDMSYTPPRHADYTLAVGSLAYYDTFAGLIPCKVATIAGISGLASTAQTVTAQLTASRGAWTVGDCITSNGLHVVPRTAVFVHSGQYRIRRYNVQVTV